MLNSPCPQTLLEPVVVDPAFSEERQAHLIDLHLEAGNFRSVIELFLDPSTSDEIKSLVKERIVEFFRSGRSKRVATTEIHLVGSHLAGEDISTAGQDLTLSGFSPESELPKTQVLRCVALVTESNGRAHLIENISEGDGTRHFHLSLPHRPDSEVFVWLDFMD